MPGSPPSRMMEPATRPPPSTRSSSPSPVVRRMASPAVTFASASGLAVPAARLAAGRSRTVSSTTEPQAEHPGHWPSQRGELWPHCWQTKSVLARLSTMRCPQVDKRRGARHVRRVRGLDQLVRRELEDLDGRGLHRSLRPLETACDPEVQLHGRRVLQLSSNN